jgi:thioredoxin reductase (NADPH)
MFAAYYAGMRDMKTKIIDYLPKLGGTVTVFYPEKYIYDVGGIPKISGRDLIEQMKEQAFMFKPTIILGQAVDHLEKKEDGTLKLVGSSGEIHQSKTVIIAAGPGLFKVRRLQLENIEYYEGKHVYYEPEDLTEFAGKRVAVFGGLSSTLEQAMQLSKTARHVYLIYNRDSFQGLEKETEQLQQSSVELKLSCKIAGLHGDGERLSQISVKSVDDGSEELLDVDDLIVSQGYHFDLDPVKKWGFTLEGRRIPVNENMETKLPGVYAAGDIAGYPKKWRLIASAFNEAITAVNSAKARIDPSAPAQVYSSILMDNEA